MLPRSLRFLDTRRQDYLPGLLDHYRPIAQGMTLLTEALKYSLARRPESGFKVLVSEVDILEAEADKIKRRIRNHLPAAGLMVVDKTLFLSYTGSQDNILDAVQEAVTWLDLADFGVTQPLALAMTETVGEAARTVDLLRPALSSFIDLVLHGKDVRADVKEGIEEVRRQHVKVVKAKRGLTVAAYAADIPFARVYQVIRFVEYVYRASHSAEGCADILRAMLAR